MLLDRTNVKGFSLLEIVLSIALFAILTAISLPAYRTFQTHTETGTSATIVAQSMRRASALSRAGEDDSSWGVYVQPGTVTMFQGSSYATRNIGEDEYFVIPSNVTITGMSEVAFGVMTGNPIVPGALTITAVDGTVETITVNEHAMVSY